MHTRRRNPTAPCTCTNKPWRSENWLSRPVVTGECPWTALTVLILPLKFEYYVSTGPMHFSGEISRTHTVPLFRRFHRAPGSLQTDSLFQANLLDAFRYHSLDEISPIPGLSGITSLIQRMHGRQGQSRRQPVKGLETIQSLVRAFRTVYQEKSGSQAVLQ